MAHKMRKIVHGLVTELLQNTGEPVRLERFKVLITLLLQFVCPV